MTQQIINIGATANDGTGDNWRDAFDKTNDNFTELFGDVASTPNVINVTQASDIDDLAVANVVTITESTVFNLQVLNVQITSRFFLDDSGSSRPRIELKAESPIFALEYIGTAGTFISGSNCDVFITNTGLVGRTSGSTLLNTDGGVVQIIGGTTRLWSDLGTHQRGDFFIRFARFAAWGAGFKLLNIRSIIASQPESLFDPAGGILFDITDNLTDQQTIQITGAPGFLDPLSSLVRIDPSFRDSDRCNITSCTLANGQLFNTDGADGTFTAAADASITSTTINTVSDVGGLAQFNFTVGPTVFVGQQVIVVGFVSNTNYNQTITITAVGAGFFRSDSIRFGSGESGGSFTSNSVTLTDTSTPLIDGDTVNIDTTLATDYDGGSVVYNKLTNSFEVSRAFTSTQAGTWSTRGLEQSNNKVLATSNSNFLDSEYIACAFVNDNTDVIAGGSITNGVFRDHDFGTAGSALIECTNAQRFKLIDEINGTFEYTGNEVFDGTMASDLTSVSTGGAVEFLFKWQKDVGAGFVDLDNNIINMDEIGGTAGSTSGHVVMILDKGDLIKPVFTRDSGASSYTVRYFNCTTTE